MDLLQRVEELNKKGKTLNDQRTRAMGRRDELQKRLDKALEEYNVKYGTSLTVDTLQAEYQKVSKDVEEQTVKLEGIISAIESGDYKTAEALSVGVNPQVVPTEPQTVASEVSQGVTPETLASMPNTEQAVGSVQGGTGDVVPPVAQSGTMPPQSAVVPPNAEEVVSPQMGIQPAVVPPQTTVAQPTVQTPPVPPVLEVPETTKDVFSMSFKQSSADAKPSDEFLDGVTPKPADVPTPPSFEGVLEGSVFN